MFLDIKLGLAWALLTSFLFHLPLSIGWILFGIGFALLPDVDFFVELLERGTVGGKKMGAHRILLHNPLTYVPLLLGLFMFFGSPLMTLAFLGTFGHFVHDTAGMGFGIRWLWPFSERFYKVFSDRDANIFYDLAHLKPVSWTPAELKKVIQEKGNDSWIREDLGYMRRNMKDNIMKLLLFIFGLLLLSKIISLTPLA